MAAVKFIGYFVLGILMGLLIDAVAKADSFHQETLMPKDAAGVPLLCSYPSSVVNLPLNGASYIRGPLVLTLRRDSVTVDTMLEPAPYPTPTLYGLIVSGDVPSWAARSLVTAAGEPSADLNGDGAVNINDLNILRSQLNSVAPPPRYLCFADPVGGRYAVREWRYNAPHLPASVDCAAASQACYGDLRACPLQP